MNVVLALWSGLLSFLSPCVFPIIPLYIGYLLGNIEGDNKRKSFKNFIAFSIGFSVFFLVFGVLIAYVSHIFIFDKIVLKRIFGVLLILIALYNIGIIKINFKKMDFTKFKYNGTIVQSFIFGAVTNLAWLPCTLPGLSLIIPIATSAKTVFVGTFYMIIYVIGFMTPFMLIAIFFDKVDSKIRGLNKYLIYIKYLITIALIVIGVLLILNKFYIGG